MDTPKDRDELDDLLSSGAFTRRVVTNGTANGGVISERDANWPLLDAATAPLLP